MYLRHQAYTFLLVQRTYPRIFMYLRVPCYCYAMFEFERIECGSEDVIHNAIITPHVVEHQLSLRHNTVCAYLMRVSQSVNSCAHTRGHVTLEIFYLCRSENEDTSGIDNTGPADESCHYLVIFFRECTMLFFIS